MHVPTSISASFGWLAYQFFNIQPLIPMYTHVIVSAIFPIYAGAHASLTRPSSAAKRDKSKKRKDDDDYDESDDDEEYSQRMEGLTTKHALILPIFAGCTLAGLYFLIKWLQDPAILNKILNWYFALFSIYSVYKLVSDGLVVLHSLVFPRDYLDRGVVYRVKPRAKIAIPMKPGPNTRSSALPSIFSRIPLPRRLNDLLWALYVIPSRKLRIKAHIRAILDLDVSTSIHGLLGGAAGISTVVWYNFVSKPWFLTNVMGFGYAYSTLQIMSPTTFLTGSLILSGLFFYDIYFVFFTPMMVTVAKSLDVPIKLLFPRPLTDEDHAYSARFSEPPPQPMSMLGLGDIVLPGILIGLALRFDLYMFYLKKQTKPKIATKSPTSSPNTRSSSRKRSPISTPASSPSKKPTSKSSESSDLIKAPYTSVAKSWGDRLWTFSLPTASRKSALAAPTYVARNAFPKPYFHAGLVGYVIGMMTTLGALQVSDRAQPALLYLVPAVLLSLWATAWVRGEVKEMNAFSDASSDDEGDDKVEKKDSKKKQADEKVSVSKDMFDEIGDDELDEPVAGRTRGQLRKIGSLEGADTPTKKTGDLASKSKKSADSKDKESDDKAHKSKWFAFSINLSSFSMKNERAGRKSGSSSRYRPGSTSTRDEPPLKRQRAG